MENTLIMSGAVTIIGEFIKWSYARFGGGEISKLGILAFTLLMSIVIGSISYLSQNSFSSQGLASNIIAIWGVAIGYYQVLVKSAVYPTLDKLKSKK